MRPRSDAWPAAALVMGLLAAILGICTLHSWDLSVRRDACEAAGGRMAWYGYGAHRRHWCDFGRVL